MQPWPGVPQSIVNRLPSRVPLGLALAIDAHRRGRDADEDGKNGIRDPGDDVCWCRHREGMLQEWWAQVRP